MPAAESPRIRPLALALIRHPREGRLLLGNGRDPDRGEEFLRPLGGGIDFGEASAETLVREIREELDLAIEIVARRAVFENIFEYAGRRHHEIVFVHEARFRDPRAYEQEAYPVRDDPETTGRWYAPEQLRPRGGTHIVYPEGLLDVLDASTSADGDACSSSIG